MSAPHTTYSHVQKRQILSRIYRELEKEGASDYGACRDVHTADTDNTPTIQTLLNWLKKDREGHAANGNGSGPAAEIDRADAASGVEEGKDVAVYVKEEQMTRCVEDNRTLRDENTYLRDRLGELEADNAKTEARNGALARALQLYL